jgi:hypothetical protein
MAPMMAIVIHCERLAHPGGAVGRSPSVSILQKRDCAMAVSWSLARPLKLEARAGIECRILAHRHCK